MCDDDDGSTGRTRGLHKDTHDLVAGLLVERSCRFIGEDDGRAYGKCAGDGDALHLSAAHFAGALLGELPQSQSFQPQHGGVGGLSVIRATQHHGQGDVFDGWQFRQQLAGLEDEAESVAAQLGAVRIAHPCQINAFKHHSTFGRGDDTGKRVQ